MQILLSQSLYILEQNIEHLPSCNLVDLLNTQFCPADLANCVGKEDLLASKPKTLLYLFSLQRSGS